MRYTEAKGENELFTTIQNQEIVGKHLFAYASEGPLGGSIPTNSDNLIKFVFNDDLTLTYNPETVFQPSKRPDIFKENTRPNASPRIARLEHFFKKLMNPLTTAKQGRPRNLMPELIELYTRYHLEHLKHRYHDLYRERFERLDKIIHDPALFSFWVDVLHQKKGLKAYHHIPKFKRHRLTNQPDSQPDQRHPFDIIAGYYYFSLTRSRNGVLTNYRRAKAATSRKEYAKAASYLKLAIKNYEKGLKTYKDLQTKNYLKEQINAFIELDHQNNWRHSENIKKAKSLMVNIHQIMQDVWQYQHEQLEAGIAFEDFGCLYRVQATDQKSLSLEKPLSDITMNTIKRMENRIEQFKNKHHYSTYLLGARNFQAIGANYQRIVVDLERGIPEEMKLALLTKNRCSSYKDIPYHEQDSELYTCLYFINHYKTITQRYFNKALTLLKAAEQLSITNRYDDIVHNAEICSGLGTLLRSFNGVKKDSITELYTDLEKSITSSWEALNRKSSLIQTRLPTPNPSPSKDTVEKIIESHTTYCTEQNSRAPVIAF